MNYQAAYFQKNPDSSYSTYADDIETPFNEFLKILIEQGIVGLLLFSYLLFGLFFRTQMTQMTQIFADKNSFISVISASFVCFILIFGLFSYPFDKLPFLMLFVFSIAIISKESMSKTVISFVTVIPRLTRNLLIFTKSIKMLLFILIILVSGKIAVDAYSYSKSCKEWNKALIHFSKEKEESLSQLKKLYPVLENNPVFLTTYGKAMGFGEHHAEAVTILEKAVKKLPTSTSYIELGKSYESCGLSEKSFECWEHSGFMVPARFTPLFLTMKLHFKNQEYELAKEFAEKLLVKKIKIDNPEIDRMKREAIDIISNDCHPALDAGSPVKKFSCNEIYK